MSYVISTSEELFSSEEYETKELAIEAAAEELDLSPGEGFCVGRREDPNPMKWMPDADDILDRMDEGAFEEAGEASEGWPNPTEADKAKLTAMVREAITKWMEETKNKPSFYLVRDVESFVVPEPQRPEDPHP